MDPISTISPSDDFPLSSFDEEEDIVNPLTSSDDDDETKRLESLFSQLMEQELERAAASERPQSSQSRPQQGHGDQMHLS